MTVYNPKEIEKEIQGYWKRKRIPEKIVKFDSKKKKFFLLDGPPYVNYIPHVGHVKTTTFKDVWGKFKQMQGFSVWWQPGFDCSGLPIENAVEKKLGITSKRDIERLGVGKFIDECKKLAEKNKPVWMSLYKNLGAWRGWVEPYLTYKNYYLESGWWSVKQMYERGLLVEGERSGFWCSHCETVLAGYEVTDSYKNVQDPSLYVKFPVKGEDSFLLVWTTTPWTLPSNVAIAVHPDETYVKVGVGEEKLILAEKRLPVLGELGKKYTLLEKYKGRQLEGMKYLRVVDTPLQREMDKKFHSIILSIPLLKKRAAAKVGGEEVFEDFVTMETGTGLVHTAPGLGDYKVGEHYNLPFLSPIDDHGCFTEGAGPYKGMQVKEADQNIIEDIQKRGLLLHVGRVTHSYPLCWRCKTPLIYRMSHQWFMKIDALREKMLRENKKVRWLPEFARERFHQILLTAPDWAVTRQRYWGIPLPVWVCQSCESKKVIGSVKELKENALHALPEKIDLHKDVVDTILLKCHCGGRMRRVKDIMDVWFDSGISPWASLGYPHKNKKVFHSLWPIDLIDESQDQTRGWFYTLMVCSQAIHGVTPFRTVCLNGWTLNEKGEKMSKSLGNVVWAEKAWKELGSDLLRLYYCVDISPWDTQKFSFRGAKELERVLNVLWHSFLFVQTYGSPVAGKHLMLKPEDRWIVSRINTLIQSMTKQLESFQFHLATRQLVEFILNDFSRWYIKLVRDRVSPFHSGPDKKAAQFTLHYVLERVVKLLSPFCPFISEKIYREMFKGESVHLKSWPKQEKRLSHLEEGMETVKQLIEAMNALRQEKKAKLRWPIDKVFVETRSDKAVRELQEVVKTMGNVKDVVFVKKLTGKGREFPGGKLALGKVLKDESLVRELTRKVQELRKGERLQVSERIQLFLKTDKTTEMILKRFEKDIREGTGSSKLTLGKIKSRKGKLEFEGKKVEIDF